MKNTKFALVIMTSDRKPNYLANLLEQLDSYSVPYTISHGTVGRDNLKEVKRGTILTMPNVEFAEKLNVWQRATLNYVHCLRVGASYSQTFNIPFIILEDDVVLSRNFFPLVQRLYDVYKFFHNESGLESIITLYSSCYKSEQTRRGVIGLSELPYDKFCGTQAVLFPNVKTALELSKRLEENLESAERHYAIEIARHCNDMSVSILMTSFSLVEHIGRVSTGLGNGNGKRKALAFVDDRFPRN